MFDAAIDHRTRHCHSQPGHFALTATADVRSHQARAAQPQTARLQHLRQQSCHQQFQQ
jgi:hypothetical protein